MNDDLNTIEMPEMEDFFNSHFISVDDRNRITRGFSDAFEPPGESDILINDKGGRHFRLKPSGEENPSLFNDMGVPLFKWTGKKVAERTNEEIQADIEAMKPPLEVHKMEGIMQTHKLLVEVLQIPIEHNSRHFSVTMEKQNLLSAQLGLFGLNSQAGIPMELSWNATGEVCEPWEFPALLELANVMAAHVEPLAQMQREAEVRIKHSKNEQEVKTHVETFRDDLWAIVGK